ncbi:ubiquitin-conjugating enzyme 9 [Rozella allomycis CSF55]|uniref:SUMO-conjugating enzyme Ubc9 domain-containing protein n=1 Tax=Rozella allomycis (strain CSF55) TaxID=988480 RepID=A0A075B160_ROZAC|nr:SUMO-conjugating enzyme Ubc9 domain-containing protein [Rozella allomycis CSF55]RKP21489.1 ubiquitin-conjugating enzyme 9 [Rozella allomycis CSF55]|eukprot:EPZ34686.1 SUMO-conjugating enzyme Ubc9 domain-containing protein [Rozella allomycis CSF55]
MSENNSISMLRLTEERKKWRKDHPIGFVAKPRRKPDGSMDMFTWDCFIPGVSGTAWENGLYPLSMVFPPSYPSQAPKCKFPAGFYHPNVYPSGNVCLDIIGDHWKPSITIKQVLLGIQELLNDPNDLSPAQHEAYKDHQNKKQVYEQNVKKQALKYKPKDE